MQKIRMIVFDVDGTLTDGRINIAATGELFKAFDVKDGYGICIILPQHGIIPAIITGRRSAIVEHRARELGIEQLYQGVADKGSCLRAVMARLGIPAEQVACMGDDLNDLPLMELCGVAACPGDAVQAVKERCDYVCRANGGYGAAREFIEWLVDGQGTQQNELRGETR